MPGLLSDLRDAFRTFRHRPAFSLLAVLTLAIGMGVNTVAFSVVNAIVFKSSNYADGDRLGWIFIKSPGNPEGGLSLPQYEAFASRATSLDGIIAEGRLPLRYAHHNAVEQLWALVVSRNYFDVLGVRAEAGRLLTATDGERPVAVVSHEFWVSKLAQAAPGQATLVLNDVEFAVVGVVPAGYQGPGGIYAPAVWVSLDTRKLLRLSAQTESPDHDWLTPVGRLRRGVAPEQAEAQLKTLLDSEPTSGVERGKRQVDFAPMKDGHPEVRQIARVASVGMALVGLVLLIACFNVAGLLLTRATERRREIAVRAALGASRWRIGRQLMTEALVLAACAGLLALALSAASGPLLATFSLPSPIPQQIDLSPDARTVLFTLCLVLVATVVPVVLPARNAARVDLQQVLAAEAGSTTGGRRATARRVFQVLQIAGATMFLALAALFVGSFRNMLVTDIGFETDRVLVVTADLETHGRTPDQAAQFFRVLADRLAADPQVRGTAPAASIPYTVGIPRGTKVAANGQDCRVARCEAADLFIVGPGYVDAMGIPLLHGRGLQDSDRAPGGGVLISRTAAERLFPRRSAVGEYLTIGAEREVAQVVGIVGDVAANGIGRPAMPQVYRAMRTADYKSAVTMVIGTRGDPLLLAGRVRREAAATDRALPLQSVQSMQDHLRVPRWPARVAAWFLAICSLLALALATVGLFGVISYAVAQRSREFGIRMALGADARTILGQVMKEGAALTAMGSAIGLTIAAAAGVLVRAALVGVSAGDPWPYLAAGAVQTVVALAACAYPATRAARVNPVVAIGK